MRLTADFPTARASALMGTMAKHFGHKIPVTQDDRQAVLTFELGQAQITADADMLRLSVEAENAESLERLRGVIESHLLRFAHREDPAPLSWSAAS